MMLEIISLLSDRQGVTRYMRSGSPARDGNQWPSEQRPHPDKVPFGPEISWPYGFRQMDPEAKELLESAYRTGPGYGQAAADDFGYGDPGYSDPSYEPSLDYSTGPRSAPPRPSGRPGQRPRDPQVPGYHVPPFASSPDPVPGAGTPGDGIWPVTGAQEALPDTGPQRAARPAYPEQWYDNPRLDDRAKLPADPRLEGMNYDELRYDDPAPGFDDQPLDDESWYAELRRGGPAYPPEDPGYGPSGSRHSGPAQSGPGQPGSGRSGAAQSGAAQSGAAQSGAAQSGAAQSGPGQRDSGQSGYGQSGYSRPSGSGASGYGQRGSGQSGPGQSGSGFGQPGLSRSGFGQSSPRQSGSGFGQPGYGHPSGPQASMATRPGPGSPARGSQSDHRGPQGRAAQISPAAGLLSAPVGLLTPPHGTPVQAPAQTLASSTPSQAATIATPILGTQRSAAVRPGHGLDGPEITSSWPAAPHADEVEDFEDFWREDDDEAEYKGLFGDRALLDKPAKVKRAIGRRRGGSNDHRLWFALGGVAVVAAAAITGIIKFEFPSHGGPVHTLVTPAKIGTYVRTQNLEKQTNVAQLRDEVIKMSSGQASNVVSAVYESGNSAAGNNEQIVMFIGGHLAHADAASSVASFDQRFPGAKPVSAGTLGGQASCVQEGTGESSVAMCAWFDNDSFGEISSPTMNTQALSAEMRAMRPSVEHVTKQ